MTRRNFFATVAFAIAHPKPLLFPVRKPSWESVIDAELNGLVLITLLDESGNIVNREMFHGNGERRLYAIAGRGPRRTRTTTRIEAVWPKRSFKVYYTGFHFPPSRYCA